MKIRFSTFFLFAVALAPATGVSAQEIDWTKIAAGAAIKASVSPEDGVPVLSVSCDNKAAKVAVLNAPFQTIAGTMAEGISFDVRGDGSAAYASILLGYPSNHDATSGYEAIFPLDATDWKTVTLRWDDFTQSYLPWDPKIAQIDTGVQLDPTKIDKIGFGWGSYFSKFYPAQASFQIRNIHFVDQVPTPVAGAYSEGWTHTLSLLGGGQKIKILLLGDSITDFGGDQSYAFFLGQKIKETWGNECEVRNCGIGGHSIRGGTIILPRSLRAMPDPDLVFIMFGANDIKALGIKPEFSEPVFKAELETLIDKVRVGTGGKADICLLSGVVRLQPNSSTSAGTVEKIVGAVKEASDERKTAFVDTFDAYAHLTPDLQKIYYRDTIHQQTPGQEFIGGLVFTQLQTAKQGH